ncbi:hypothetical protein TYRP_010532 [Tyrophagus putrescentiae]|nr:hypothetical protein TYRP_010532 [Tyrophagus putrescentiae]
MSKQRFMSVSLGKTAEELNNHPAITKRNGRQCGFGGLWVYASAVKLKSEREQGKGKERAAEIGRIDLVSPLAANGPNRKAVPGYASL